MSARSDKGKEVRGPSTPEWKLSFFKPGQALAISPMPPLPNRAAPRSSKLSKRQAKILRTKGKSRSPSQTLRYTTRGQTSTSV
ncbi:hypothetical protein M407DRAFT_243003 [Tulasnella calospora MUT 4182]|uniref:Uncharacterized protein n=1 Tax=Tulasnella calospora MUT 4182 TaxID=1051891 RepID=A0A0C3QLI7_9AGAM|nr:hypothetical protein M407DRAFT_243003 [Tulasnella calospora MUT 4182]